MITAAPSFTVGDAGELCAASVIRGLAHSPGYPLFILLGKVIITLIIPWGNYAYRINLLSGTVTIIYHLLCSWLAQGTPENNGESNCVVPSAAAVAAACLAVSPAF